MKTKKILVVEDEIIVAADIKSRLDLLGYEVAGSCSTGEKALVMIEQTAPDVVLMDIHLAGELDGIMTAQEIRQRFQTPVIFLTAYSEDSTIQRAKVTEPFGFLLKPFEDRALKTAIELALYRHQSDFEHSTTSQLLEICNRASTIRTLMQALTAFFQRATNCEAVGVRLHQDDDFPYFETRGFAQEFIHAENSLCQHDITGKVVRDNSGKPLLECMCGNVLCGRFDPTLPFFTKHGSFWSSGTTELLATTTNADRQTRTRNRCNGEGYESVALLPMKYGERTFGLFQFNDRRKGRFTLERIEHLERLVDYVSIALSKHLSEDSLRESESRYRALFNATTDAVYAFRILPDNRPGVIFEANDVACRMLGYSQQELIGLEVHHIDAPESEADVSAIIERMKVGGSVLFPQIHLTRDGRRIPVEVNARIFEYQGSPAVLSTVRDVSERLKEEKERLNQEREIQQNLRAESLGVLAGGIAHDFNNILMAIQGHADLGLLELPATHPVRENFEAIERSSRRAADLCTQMLAYAGRGRFVLETIDLTSLLESFTQLLQASVARFSKNSALNYCLEKQLPNIEGSIPQLRQVVMNLITNSAEAIGDRPGIIGITSGTMSCTREYLAKATLGRELPAGMYVFFEISDTGCGMDQHTLERLFDPFFTTKFMGRGLGMPAVLGIVRSHKGALNIASEVGKGTTIRILFPMARAKSDVPEVLAVVPAPAPAPCRRRILLVDDEPELLTIGTRMLTRLGFQVITAADGREAVKIYDEKRSAIDLVLLDLTMPNMDGVEAFHCLLHLDPDVSIIIASGYSDAHIRDRVAGKALHGVLLKPYSEKTLKAALQKVFPDI